MKFRHTYACMASVLLLIVSTTHAALASTYYVSATGNDLNAGSSSAPWQTIQKAASAMVAGDSVLIGDGDYAGGITPDESGTSDAPITYKAINPGKVIVHGD